MKRIKKSLIILLVSIVIFILPLFPLFFIEPVHVGKDPNIYSEFGNGYQKFLLAFAGFIWATIVRVLTRVFLKGVLIEDKEEEDER
jgi:hypothetical protein